VVAGSPAEEIGLELGDRIISAKLSNYKEEIEIGSWNLLLNAANASNGKGMILSGERDGERFEKNVVARRDEKLAMGFLGLESQMKLKKVQLGLLPAVNLGVRNSYMWAKRILQTLHGLFVSRKISFKALSGPVGIPVIGMYFVERGFGTFLYFLGMLGINFAVINIIPFPIVDGGVLVLLGLEKLRGKPLSIKVQTVIQQVGIAILGAAFLALTIQDVGRFFGR
jgi:regulator of sigma E protease